MRYRSRIQSAPSCVDCRRFSGTRHSAENPLRAATAYEDTKNAIEEAEESATKAEQAANEALEEVCSWML